ncbi:fimbrillin family protein [uncultured Muribaculum sp.]|uniref:fimbrillin family protein n=1 Tax=uncultured Muribaculum sp. TaxID=1918613 RepID=UPI0025966BEC|nr:fimbrillin family protein [uncultured Muribaculum sp.]
MNKTINHIFLSMLLTAIAATVASCTDELDLPADSSPTILLPGEYRFIIGHDDEPPMSRVEYTDEKSSRFETGDRIGVFATNSEKQIQNDVFSARYLDGTSVQVLAPPKGNVTQGLDTEIPTGDTIQYIFYHPMNPEWKLSDITRGTGLSYSVESDQSTKEAYEHSDFLWNYLNSKPDEPIQVIKMHHLMANIIVRIHRDSIDNSNDADNGVTLKNIHTSASNIQLTKQLNKEMNYHVPSNGTVSDIKMYCQGESGEYLIYRAAVPAWQTLAEGSEIISVNLFNRAGDTEKVTYTLAAPLLLKDGYYYTFTLRSAVKPAVPEVSDDDSWVLDVFDPETNEIVGLLCREYIRYQPHHNTPELNLTTDAPTGYYENAYEHDSGHPIKGYAISSQAYVFYNLFDNSYLPNMENGTILRMLYDIVATRDGIMQADPAFPAPHHFGSIAIGGGGADMAMGFFRAKHGHRWIYDESLGYGRSSDDWVEHGLHGSKIHWAATNGYKYEPTQKDTIAKDLIYYHIDNLIVPDNKITNKEADSYGHVAIPANGKPFVSYTPFDDGEIRDYDGNKIAYIREHYLVDSRSGINYPLVKIGFNNFWMSKSYRSTKLSDGTEIICQNAPQNSANNYVNFTPSYQNWGNWKILGPSYLHPRYIEGDIEDIDFTNINTEHPLLYNYSAIIDKNFIPESDDSRFMNTMPTIYQFQKIMNYFGWGFGAKLMTDDSWTFIKGGTNNHDDAVESKREALLKYKTVTNAFLPVNVSGFNLQASGNFRSSFRWFGGTANLWIDNDTDDDSNPLTQLDVLLLDMPKAWQSQNFSTVFYVENFSAGILDQNKDEKSQTFYPVRFVMHLDGQIDQNPIMPISSMVKSLSRSASAQPDHKPESTVVSVHVIECKE